MRYRPLLSFLARWVVEPSRGVHGEPCLLPTPRPSERRPQGRRLRANAPRKGSGHCLDRRSTEAVADWSATHPGPTALEARACDLGPNGRDRHEHWRFGLEFTARKRAGCEPLSSTSSPESDGLLQLQS